MSHPTKLEQLIMKSPPVQRVVELIGDQHRVLPGTEEIHPVTGERLLVCDYRPGTKLLALGNCFHDIVEPRNLVKRYIDVDAVYDVLESGRTVRDLVAVNLPYVTNNVEIRGSRCPLHVFLDPRDDLMRLGWKQQMLKPASQEGLTEEQMERYGMEKGHYHFVGTVEWKLTGKDLEHWDSIMQLPVDLRIYGSYMDL